MVVWQLAKRRQGTHKQKYRHEVAFSSKKIYRQKGLGKARHKDRRAPLFIRGGHVFPKKPRDYSFKMNRRVRHLALRMALTTKYLQSKLIIVEKFKIKEPKTKVAASMLNGINVRKDSGTFMLVDGWKVDESFERASWNLNYVNYVSAKALNVYDILRSEKLIISAKTLDIIKHRWRKYDPYHQEIDLSQIKSV
jgi:large subunit ribosomal protein L4